jgi:hypothetical protein
MGSSARIASVAVGGLACLLLVIACGVSAPGGVFSSPVNSPPGGCGGATATGSLSAPSPACSMPGPTESPWPVGQAEAAAAANAFTGRSDLAVTGQWRNPARLYVVQDAIRTAVVDGTTGAVVESIQVDPSILPGPDGEPPAWSPAPVSSPDRSGDGGRARAMATAERFLSAHGLSAPHAPSATRVDGPGAPVWVVTWTGADGAPAFEVAIANATGGLVGFVDRRRSGAFVAVPRLDRDTAVRLAIARANADQGRTDEQLTSVEFIVELPPGGQLNTWRVGLGVPRPDPSAGGTVWAFGSVIDVDATTGAITVVK